MLRSLIALSILELILASTPTFRALLLYTTLVTKLSVQLVLAPPLLMSLTMSCPFHPAGLKALAYTMMARLLTSANGSASPSVALFNVIQLHPLPTKLKPPSLETTPPTAACYVALLLIPLSSAPGACIVARLDTVTRAAGMLRSVGRSVRLGRWGFCPECRQGVERICRAITKQV
jgi:hypothetical protein